MLCESVKMDRLQISYFILDILLCTILNKFCLEIKMFFYYLDKPIGCLCLPLVLCCLEVTPLVTNSAVSS